MREPSNTGKRRGGGEYKVQDTGRGEGMGLEMEVGIHQRRFDLW